MSARRAAAAAELGRTRGRPQRGAAPPVPRALLAKPGVSVAAAERTRDDVPRSPQPDWIANRLAVSGPAADVAAFRTAAEGAGVVPWRVDDRAAEERWLGLMLAAGAQRGGPSLAAEARHVAGALRAAWLDEASAAASEAGVPRGCPLDLHALLPVPAPVLALGPDDPAALRWMWENWGTTWPLRRVHVAGPVHAADGEAALVYEFFSADWSPWQALVRMRRRWRALRFGMRPRYA